MQPAECLSDCVRSFENLGGIVWVSSRTRNESWCVLRFEQSPRFCERGWGPFLCVYGYLVGFQLCVTETQMIDDAGLRCGHQ